MRKRREQKKKDLGKIVAEALDHLTFMWRAAVRGPRLRGLAAAGAFVLVVAMLLARQGTGKSRAGALALMVGAAGAVVALAYRERRIWEDPSQVIERLAGQSMPEEARKAQRALTLLDDEGEPKDIEGTSPVLVRLHVARALAALPRDRIAEQAGVVARRFGIATIVLAAMTVAAIATNPWGVVEGGDVLLARAGKAPIGMGWIGDADLDARPPDYLHEDERPLHLYARAALPRGSVITFRGVPVHSGRRLLLSDGTNEVPFVDDGTGRVVARWPLEGDVGLRVVARFGDVRIEDSDATSITSIADLAPVVLLEGAPKQFRLADTSEPIAVRYQASDDHGLREVHLVLRSGAREERRVLAKLDGDTKNDRGGYVLKATDGFFKKSHAAVEITVEAKDNDPITGPKWGVSAPFTVIPPEVGEPAAQRLAAMRSVRDAFVDALAHRLTHEIPTDATARKALVAEEKAEHASNAALLEKTLGDSYAGVVFAGRLKAMLRAQAKKLDLAMTSEAAGPSATTHTTFVKATETMVLVVDGVVRGQGLKDAKDSAKLLADVADDLALGASQMQSASEAERGGIRFSVATTVLAGGQKHLAQMGTLGRDFAGVIQADLLRTERAKGETDWPHAELAARDLSARLHQPDPSFGAKGGGGGHATGESGGSGGQPGENQDESGGEAERAFNEAAQELESLAQDHAGEISQVEQALNQAESQEDLDKLKEEAKDHAQAVREATRDLPSIGGGSDSWTSKGAAARELSEQMARSLEQGNPADAVQSGKGALQALDEAKRIAGRERYYDDDVRGADKRLDDTKKKLEPEVKWAEDRLEKMRKQAAQRAAGELEKKGEEEGKLSERAGQLEGKAREKGSLPEPALEALDDARESAREAAEALKRGDADLAMQRQRDAQRKLEAAKQALGQEDKEDNQEQSQGSGDGEQPDNTPTPIPNANAHKGPEEFRRRVVKGLAQQGSARQREAVKRYAEGLLR